MKKSKLLMLLACLVSVLVLSSVTAFATVTEPEKYPVRINGSRFASNGLTKTCGAGTAKLDVTTTPYTLTLTNATIEAKDLGPYMCGIQSEVDLEIVLKGENVINGGAYSGSAAYGIRVAGSSLKIYGDGKLTVTGGTPAEADSTSYGIYVKGTLVASATDTITAKGADGTNIRHSGGIYTSGAVTVAGGTVVAEGGASYYRSYGIRADGGAVKVSGGKLTAKAATGGTQDYSYGIYTSEAASVSGGILIANGYGAKTNSYGIYSGKTMTVTGGTVTADSGKAVSGDSYAVYAAGDFVLENGKITATGGEALNTSLGIAVSET